MTVIKELLNVSEPCGRLSLQQTSAHKHKTYYMLPNNNKIRLHHWKSALFTAIYKKGKIFMSESNMKQRQEKTLVGEHGLAKDQQPKYIFVHPHSYIHTKPI